MTWRLYCPRCGWESGSGEYEPFCPRCGGPLELRGRLEGPGEPILGEGRTPAVRVGGDVYKLEYLNPTGSFKDRGASLSVWLASRLGYRCVVEDSSGNTGLSVAAYAGRLGLRARIHVPSTIGRGKLRLLRFLGAEVIVHGSREEALMAARREKKECFYVAHATSPVFIEGVSSIGAELAPLLDDRPVIVPASSGTLLLGVYRGVLRATGRAPRIVAVQSPGAASLSSRVKRVHWIGGGSGVLADALVLRDPPRLEEMAAATSMVVVVGDEAIRESWRRLASTGFIVEPSSAVVLAAKELIGEDSVLVLTGSGLKYTDLMDGES